jgi:hypothetical protein
MMHFKSAPQYESPPNVSAKVSQVNHNPQVQAPLELEHGTWFKQNIMLLYQFHWPQKFLICLFFFIRPICTL